MEKKIGIVDYGRGNLRSVEKALQCVGATTVVLPSAKGLAEVDAVVLPGVGSFGDCATSLHERGHWEPLREWLRADRPFLGICLGYQILFEGSEESPDVKGLGVFPGMVRRFPSDGILKVPHMGWNQLQFATSSPLFTGLLEDTFAYFVHSYFPSPTEESLVTAWSEYGVRFAAAVGLGRVQAVQFHPEKSQATGLAILQNFLKTLSI